MFGAGKHDGVGASGVSATNKQTMKQSDPPGKGARRSAGEGSDNESVKVRPPRSQVGWRLMHISSAASDRVRWGKRIRPTRSSELVML